MARVSAVRNADPGPFGNPADSNQAGTALVSSVRASSAFDPGKLTVEVCRIEVITPYSDCSVLNRDRSHDRKRDRRAAFVLEDIHSLVENDIPVGGDGRDLPVDGEGGSEPEVGMEFPDILAPDDVGERHIVVQYALRQQGDGFVDAVGAPMGEEGLGNVDRLRRHGPFLGRIKQVAGSGTWAKMPTFRVLVRRMDELYDILAPSSKRSSHRDFERARSAQTQTASVARVSAAIPGTCPLK